MLPFDQQVVKITESLNIQTKAFPDELFGVLCPRRVDVDIMYDALCNSGVEAPVTKQVYEEGSFLWKRGPRCASRQFMAAKGWSFEQSMVRCLSRYESSRYNGI